MGSMTTGTCSRCGQELVLAPDGDCWHPWDVQEACPPEPEGTLRTNPDEWQAWFREGNRTGRPGRQYFVPDPV